MEFEPTPEIKEENTQIDLSGGLVDQHFALDLSELITSAASGAGGDSSSSISSNSPPHEWHASWMDSTSVVNPTTGIFGDSTTPSDFDIQNGINSMMDFTAMSEINNMHLGMPMDMFTQPFSFMLPPEELHKSPNTFPMAQQTMAPVSNSANGAVPMDYDIVETIKRLTGITSAQVAGAPSSFNVGLHEQYTIPASFSDHSYSSASSDRSSVPPQTIEPRQASTPTSDSALPVTSGGSPVVATATTTRPKTAHTTIERRYRTNLNTCIVGLRDSIPAVRYLDKGYKPPSGIPDVLDENGYVDGVKVARKISKATIMSKAREYIVVLKRRENRLQDELAGMKELLSSLVGGPLLLQEWERQWAARQAAQTMDDELDSNEFDSEMEDEDDDEDRPRKKPKPSPVVAAAKLEVKRRAKPAVVGTGVTPEERPKKRGRPPKTLAAAGKPQVSTPANQITFTPMPHNVPTIQAPVPPAQQQANQQQFSFVPGFPQQQKRPAVLLASFVFLSFFKPSPRASVIVTEEATNHSHIGQVLGDDGRFGQVVEQSWSHSVLHIVHTAIMIALFMALVVSVVPGRWRAKAWRWATKAFYTPAIVADDNEAIEDEVVPLKERAERELKANGTAKSKVKVFNAFQAQSTRSAEELALMALLRFSTKQSHALELWEEASLIRSKHQPYYAALELPLPQAVELVQSSSRSDPRSPLMIIASKVVESNMERMFKDAFVDEVISVCETKPEAARRLPSRRTRDDLVKLAVGMGGRPAEYVKQWNVVFSGQYSKILESNPASSDDAAFALIKALSLIRRLFPTTAQNTSDGLPSPPPSPLLQEEQVKMERFLRVSLDAKIFHCYGSKESGQVDKEVSRAKDMLISKLSHAARLRRLAILEGEERE